MARLPAKVLSQENSETVNSTGSSTDNAVTSAVSNAVGTFSRISTGGDVGGVTDQYDVQLTQSAWDFTRCLRCSGGVSCRKCYGVEDPGEGQASLDKYCQVPTGFGSQVSNQATTGWSRQQRRGYHRILSCLTYWQAHGYQVRWLCLTTAPGGDAQSLAYHHQILKQRVERRLGYQGIEHFMVRTDEGNGVLHVLWAWVSPKGYRKKLFFIGQRWLSKNWLQIHGAYVVWIAKVKLDMRAKKRISRYAITQYVGGHDYRYMSWSWKRTFGVPLVKCWRWFKRQFVVGGLDRIIRMWHKFLCGQILVSRNGWFSLGLLRATYQELGDWQWL